MTHHIRGAPGRALHRHMAPHASRGVLAGPEPGALLTHACITGPEADGFGGSTPRFMGLDMRTATETTLRWVPDPCRVPMFIAERDHWIGSDADLVPYHTDL